MAIKPLIAAPLQNTNQNQNSDEQAKPSDLSNQDNSLYARPTKSLISIEDSIKLRNDINEYSRTVDPAHVQIEERRRIMHDRLKARFQAADMDNNNVISRDEAEQFMPQILRHFSDIDTNNDGVITLEELENLQTRIVERQRQEQERKDAELAAQQVAAEQAAKKKATSDASLNNKKRSM
ncbi:MAG TPA: histidine kinase [Methyloradius sp.]|nr:histidine kinase [Methyloradius sp.]